MVKIHKYKIRKLTTSTMHKDYFGITIPNKIATQFSGTTFSVTQDGDQIILKSGADCNIRTPNFEVLPK